MKNNKDKEDYIDNRIDAGPHETKPLMVKATFSFEQVASFFKKLFNVKK